MVADHEERGGLRRLSRGVRSGRARGRPAGSLRRAPPLPLAPTPGRGAAGEGGLRLPGAAAADRGAAVAAVMAGGGGAGRMAGAASLGKVSRLEP
jgi:hypothetical protein